METSLSLISLNIEGKKHLDLVIPFIKKHSPDVLLLQEVCRDEVALFETEMEAKGHFAPMVFSEKWDDEQGVALFTALPHHHKQGRYAGNMGPLQKGDLSSREALYKSMSYWFVSADIEKGGKMYTVGTTHFPVSEQGEATWYQREALQGLQRTLGSYEHIIFSGDMNAPRGGEVFLALADVYTDHVPARCLTSIDGAIHRAGPLPLLVDVLFSTKEYSVSHFEYVSGVSDHYAITATIHRQ